MADGVKSKISRNVKSGIIAQVENLIEFVTAGLTTACDFL